MAVLSDGRLLLPMLFTGEMMQALIYGKKTQTRRLMKRQPPETHYHVLLCDRVGEIAFSDKTEWGGNSVWPSLDKGMKIPHPAGSLVWCRETWADVNSGDGPGFLFRADAHYRPCSDDEFPVNYDRYPNCKFTMWWSDLLGDQPEHNWRPSIFMPLWVTRQFCEVVEAKAQRLHDMTDEDAIAEGIQSWCKDGKLWKHGAAKYHFMSGEWDFIEPWADLARTPREAYFRLFDSINGAGTAATNPWVWAYTLKKIEKPECLEAAVV